MVGFGVAVTKDSMWSRLGTWYAGLLQSNYEKKFIVFLVFACRVRVLSVSSAWPYVEPFFRDRDHVKGPDLLGNTYIHTAHLAISAEAPHQ